MQHDGLTITCLTTDAVCDPSHIFMPYFAFNSQFLDG